MLLDANGQEVVRQQKQTFSTDEARLIRAYKKFLQKHGLGATHWCRECQRAERDFELRIVAKDSSIVFECPHRLTTFDGYTP